MKRTNKKRTTATDRIAITVSILCIITLVILFLVDNLQSKILTNQLSEIAKQQNIEEQALLEKVNTEYNSDMAIVSQYLPGIVCWGDSLTAGAGGNGVTYPKVLQSLIQENICDKYDLKSPLNSKYTYLMDPTDYSVSIPVINMGVGGENTLTILGRNGAIPYVLSNSLVIPSDTTPVEIHFTSEDGQGVAPLRQGQGGVNSVTIDGIEGTLSIKQESSTSKEYSYYFTRSLTGEKKTVSAGTEIITFASQHYLDFITVIFIGQNGGYSDLDDFIHQQRAIINQQTANNDRFIIVGLHTGTAESRNALETAMEKEYGKHYINLREYMATQAMTDAGLEPTEEDINRMKQGSTPASLLSDHIHFNSIGYELIGELIYSRMNTLGYFDEVKAAIASNYSQFDQ